MKLGIYSLKRVIFQGEAESLNCKTVLGEITVLDNHQTFITILTEGAIKVGKRMANGEKKEYLLPIKSGFLEVKEGNEVRCIVEE